MDVKPEPEKVVSSIVSIELGMVIEVRLLQPANAIKPILVTELGIITDVSSSHWLNADEPILVTELGILMDVILVTAQILLGNVCTLFPMLKVVNLLHPLKGEG